MFFFIYVRRSKPGKNKAAPPSSWWLYGGLDIFLVVIPAYQVDYNSLFNANVTEQQQK